MQKFIAEKPSMFNGQLETTKRREDGVALLKLRIFGITYVLISGRQIDDDPDACCRCAVLLLLC